MKSGDAAYNCPVISKASVSMEFYKIINTSKQHYYMKVHLHIDLQEIFPIVWVMYIWNLKQLDCEHFAGLLLWS